MTARYQTIRHRRAVGSGARAVLAALTLAACHADKPFTPPPKAAKLWFTTPPGVTTAGVPINPGIQVAILDADGNAVTTATNTVTIMLALNPTGATLLGTTTMNAVSGVATFSHLRIDKASDGYELAASSGDLRDANSSSFRIDPGSPAKLTFAAEPSNTAVGAVIVPAVQVAILDSVGNTVTDATNAVTVALYSDPRADNSPPPLSGTTTVNAIKGIATFTDLSIDTPSAGNTLIASSGALWSNQSQSFDIIQPISTKIVLTATRNGSMVRATITKNAAGNTATNTQASRGHQPRKPS